MSKTRIVLVTAGVMLSLFLASMESTVVATAMPTIVGQLGGLEHYSWVFSAFMLASTTTVPLYGKLSDSYGRRKVYGAAMALFLLGSLLCGQANTLTQLIMARAVQGIGAGGIMPLAFTLIGEMFSLEQRTKMQGVFSGVWGVSSVVGPLLGGLIVDQFSWHWIFYINIVPGLLAGALVVFGWQDKVYTQEKPSVDYVGAALLSAGVILFLLGLMNLSESRGWVFLAVSLGVFIILFQVERRVADPILPLALFQDRLFSVASLHGLMSGWAVFGTISFIPLFVQSVLGASPTQAGITITPMLMGWVGGSIFGTRILLKVGYRRLGLIGASLCTIGAGLMTIVGAETDQRLMMVFVTMIGLGMGLSVPAFVIAVQTTVERRHLGVATSMMQFSRSMGGTLGVSVMGVVLSARLASNLNAAGLNPDMVSQLLDPTAGSATVLDAGARIAMADAIHFVFVIAFVATWLALSAVVFTPRKELTDSPVPAPAPTD